MNVQYAIQFSQDGNMVCATYHDFINLHESPAGFGETRRLAMMALQQEAPLRCGKPLWWGYGAPAGHCGKPAYSGEPFPAKPATWNWPAEPAHVWFCRETAKCPDHGGLTWEKAVETMIGASSTRGA